MDAVDRLERDHVLLRAKLTVLEYTAGLGPEAWMVLRELCRTLARQLRDHMRREEALIASVQARVGMDVPPGVVVAHHDEPEQLGRLNRLFALEDLAALGAARPVLRDLIAHLRAHMAEEEDRVFPLLRRYGAVLPASWEPATGPGELRPEMTVNRVLQDYPATRAVFERWFVNVPHEGCACLDEVAWRHGLETDELIGMLRDAIPRRGSVRGPRLPVLEPLDRATRSR